MVANPVVRAHAARSFYPKPKNETNCYCQNEPEVLVTMYHCEILTIDNIYVDPNTLLTDHKAEGACREMVPTRVHLVTAPGGAV